MHRIGIDLGGTKIEGILMDAKGEIVETVRVSTPDSYFGTVKTIHEMTVKLDEIVDNVCPVGLGTPGAWVPQSGTMKNCNSTVLNGKPFLHDLQRLLNRPIRIANDANCMALSEAVDGAAAEAHCVFGVILGTGVGGGCVVNQDVIAGPNLLAGEWGHNRFPSVPTDAGLVVNPNEKPRTCYCGETNCVETFLSGRGLETTHLELHGERMTAPAIGRGETDQASRTVDEYIQQLAVALAVVVNIVDPDVIVIGGGLSNISRIYDKLPALLEKYAFSSEGATEVVPAKYGDSSGRRGAAWLFPAVS
ncbi:MAG: ROK family protein [Gammaproteobacteria bacterium]|nr:ROK family protein [Gammaproteobacteria bacterium]